MTQTVHGPHDQRATARQLGTTSGARLFAAYWGCLAAVDLTRAAPGPLRLGVVVVVVAACSLHQPAGTAVATGVVGWLFVDGFVSHADGALALDGPGDAARLVALVTVALAAAALTRRHRIERAR